MQINPEDFISFYINKSGYFIPKDSVDVTSPDIYQVEAKAIATAIDLKNNELLSVLTLLDHNFISLKIKSPYTFSLYLDQVSKAILTNISGVKYNISSNFDSYAGQLIASIQPKYILSVRGGVPANRENDFCQCVSCQDIIHMAGPNQPDGTFICFLCRQYPSRQYY